MRYEQESNLQSLPQIWEHYLIVSFINLLLNLIRILIQHLVYKLFYISHYHSNCWRMKHVIGIKRKFPI
uniref:Uncharacterized protein n=1 Tax=Myoviridae sp. ctNQV2 TaxID=2827683 RepID=A0A8S5S0C9_9CAUD|nr:MAG TPA: hypothetical protein [Myoviridae sp. ctNQV2]